MRQRLLRVENLEVWTDAAVMQVILVALRSDGGVRGEIAMGPGLVRAIVAGLRTGVQQIIRGAGGAA